MDSAFKNDRIRELSNRIDNIEKDIKLMQIDIDTMKNNIDTMNNNVNNINSQLVCNIEGSPNNGLSIANLTACIFELLSACNGKINDSNYIRVLNSGGTW